MVSTLLPLLLSTAYFGSEPNLLLEREFGLGLRPDQLYLGRYGYLPGAAALVRNRGNLFDVFYRPPGELSTRPESSVQLDKDALKLELDVRHFKPEEIELKLVDKFIVVSGKHEEQKDEEHGLVSRQFVRRYYLSDNLDADQISSSISSDGLLTIRVPVKQSADQQHNEKTIKIEYTGKPAPRPAQPQDVKPNEQTEATEATEHRQPDSSSTASPSTTPEK